MDDDPWISWKMAQTDDELHKSRQSHEKPKGPTAIRKEREEKERKSAGPMNECLQKLKRLIFLINLFFFSFFFLLFFFLVWPRSDLVVFGRGQTLQSFHSCEKYHELVR